MVLVGRARAAPNLLDDNVVQDLVNSQHVVGDIGHGIINHQFYDIVFKWTPRPIFEWEVGDRKKR